MSDYYQMKKTSSISGGNSAFIEGLYEDYLADPSSVSAEWKSYFDELRQNHNEAPRLIVQEKFEILAKLPKAVISQSGDSSLVVTQAKVDSLIAAYRNSGHKSAKIDPLDLREKADVLDLDYRYHGLTDTDLEQSFSTGTLFVDQKEMKLKDLISYLQTAYTNTVGLEVNHLNNITEKRWLQERVENFSVNVGSIPAKDKKDILLNLVKAEGMEKYLHTRYVGQKRFSLEGGDSLIPLMDSLIQRLGAQGTKEVVIGMAHRGRLNVLINIMGKLPEQLFNEFEGRTAQENKAGDVKYHLGFSSDVETPGGDMHLSLAFNPSHLEIVNPVVQGSVRARMERRKKTYGNSSAMGAANEVVPIQIHGDAAFANQGVIQETLQLSQVRGYRVGGTVHIVINNQVGFTTSNPLDARSSYYCSDPAKIIESPVIHVNGDDPEAVVMASILAADYVHQFKKDIVIDLVCYRRLGHNEADEPAATQPLMYQKIRSRKTTLGLYADKLISENVITSDELAALQQEYKDTLDAGKSVSRPIPLNDNSEAIKAWEPFINQDWDAPVDTTYDKSQLVDLANKIFSYPESFNAHRVVQKLYDSRKKMILGESLCDWGFAENLAYGTLLLEGYQVRLSGEDSGRGTFAHRHAVIHDSKTGESYLPLSSIGEKLPPLRIIDSILSEEAVLGYEYGFSLAESKALVIWEAQFGDFANGAQVLFDQFIASGEAKWDRFCGLTVMLPHGYEGQGPEHSSARLERYLQLCSQNNMRVCIPTTPAQIFHLLRLQVIQKMRKPLIILTPKSLLRHKLAVNTMDDLASGQFQTVIPEVDELNNDKVERVIFCSGKVFYDLLEKRREKKQSNVAIIRMEQIYPFAEKEYAKNISKYKNVKSLVWVQEEPQNQGAWRNILHLLQANNPSDLSIEYIGRKSSPSTAAGYASIHNKEQQALVNAALDF